MPTINVEKNNVSIGIALSTIEPTTQSKNIKPTKEEQIVVPDDGVFALSKVTVESIPEEYIIPKGTLDINANGTYDVTDYKNAEVKIASNVKKGLIIHSYDEDGFVTDASIIGMQIIPAYYFAYSAYYSEKNDYHAWLSKMEKEFIISEDTTEIGKYAFSNCTNLKISKLPKSLVKIKDGAFSGCTNLTITELHEGITEIGINSFSGCSLLNIDKFPSTVRSIGITSFQNCTSIKKLTIDHSLMINNGAFRGCTSLETVIVDKTTFSSQMNSFEGCTKLTKFIFKNIQNVPTLSNTNIFNSTPIKDGTGYVYMPDNLVEKAKTAYNWTYFATQIRPLSELEEEV